MKCVYEAANGVEAHMVANMLEQHEIATRIDGEYLTSGIGELPAAGLVRVMTDECNFERAREIIRDWEAKSPPDSVAPAAKRSFGSAWFLLGVAVTVGAMSWIYRPRAPVDGVDFNGDGRLDERYVYTDQALSRVEIDANLDGKVDAVYRYDSHGMPVSSELDSDFDGRFETKQTFERRLLKTVDIDWELDGKIDRHEDYLNGVLSTVTLYAPDGFHIVKREYYDRGILVRAEYDSDRDGIFDTSLRYDRYGEIVQTDAR
jgi:hypothetical protein